MSEKYVCPEKAVAIKEIVKLGDMKLFKSFMESAPLDFIVELESIFLEQEEEITELKSGITKVTFNGLSGENGYKPNCEECQCCKMQRGTEDCSSWCEYFELDIEDVDLEEFVECKGFSR